MMLWSAFSMATGRDRRVPTDRGPATRDGWSKRRFRVGTLRPRKGAQPVPTRAHEVGARTVLTESGLSLGARYHLDEGV